MAPEAPKSCAGSCTHHARIMRGPVLKAQIFSKIIAPGTPTRNGTPEQCWNDQVHKVILQLLHQALSEVTGKSRVFRKRPRDSVSLKKGGVYRTDSNAPRGPTPYLYVAALAARWEELPQTTLLAAAVRLGYLTKQQAAELMGGNMEAVSAGLVDLQQRQAAVKKYGIRLHTEQDFTGTPGSAGDPPQVPQKELEILRGHAREVRRLKRKLLPEANTPLMAPSHPRSTDEVVNTWLHVHRDTSAGSSMMNIAANPHSGNVDKLEYFRKAVALLLASANTWKKARAQLQDDVLEWHFVKLREGYTDLVADGDSRVTSESRDGAVRQVPLSRFIWDIIRALHHKSPDEREEFARIFVGDFKAKSTNPTARHCKPRP